MCTDSHSTITSSASAENRSIASLSWCSNCPHPTSKVAKKSFWTAGTRKIPRFTCSPWDSYELFLELCPDLFLVLCNNRTEVRVMKVFGLAIEDNLEGIEILTLLEIQHPNFSEICEAFKFRNEVFVILEYVGFSIQDLLQRSIYPMENEIAYIITQVLAGLRFIWSRNLRCPQISIQNILVSPKGEVKIDHTHFPDDDENASVSLRPLGTIMLEMMNETKETLKYTAMHWSAEALDFIEATNWATPDELSNHLFASRSMSAKILTPLCTLTQFNTADIFAVGRRKQMNNNKQGCVLDVPRSFSSSLNTLP